MTATATKPEKPVQPKAHGDVYLWRSWHWVNAYVGSLDPETAIQELCKSAGGWRRLAKIATDPRKKFTDETLLVMRTLMALPDHEQPEYWKESPWLDPTQDWVGEQIREFVKWHLQTIGEPKESDDGGA